eukprot:19718-Heterococcus_DN1.PRE.3
MRAALSNMLDTLRRQRKRRHTNYQHRSNRAPESLSINSKLTLLSALFRVSARASDTPAAGPSLLLLKSMLHKARFSTSASAKAVPALSWSPLSPVQFPARFSELSLSFVPRACARASPPCQPICSVK